jgi:hypothetical protein
MWATHRGLSKPCANRASCPSPALGSCGSDRCQGFLSGLHLQIQEITEQDWLLAILASTAEPQDSAKMVALGASSLAEVAYVALCAFIDGVGDECGSLAERLSKEFFLQVWQGGVAQTVATLAAGNRAIASAAAAARLRAQHALWRDERRSWTVTRIVTDGVCGDWLRHAAPLRRVDALAWRLVDDTS